MKSAEFYLIVLPGLEPLALRELKRWYPDLSNESVVASHGGITVMLPLDVGLGMNAALKIPTRILLRVGNFKCRDFPKLFQKISKWDWAAWLDVSCSMSVVVSSSTSRLNMKKRLEETVLDGWKAYQKKTGVKAADASKAITLYVRLKDDVCYLSLDTSGEKLHKRTSAGEDKWVGAAPLRETIAAAMVEMMFGGSSDSSEKPITAIDPMMGSGTFLIEALTYGRVSAREFAFENLKSRKVMLPKVPAFTTPATSAVGVEKDPKTLKAAQENFARAGVEEMVSVVKQDFMKLKDDRAFAGVGKKFIFCNPPYGKRIKVEGPLKEFYENLLLQMEKIVQPTRASMIIPTAPIKGKLKLPLGWKVLELVRTTNGGIPVGIYMFDCGRG